MYLIDFLICECLLVHNNVVMKNMLNIFRKMQLQPRNVTAMKGDRLWNKCYIIL